MLLAIDVRNTHTVVGLISGSGSHAKVIQNWRIRTEAEITADELSAFHQRVKAVHLAFFDLPETARPL